MFKKLLILAILIACGYVGYVVWGNLSQDEKTALKQKAGDVVDKAKDGLKNVGEKATGPVKEAIRTNLMDGDNTPKAEARPTEKK